MGKIYSYVLRYDDGAAPNPFWDICTLTICKPAIRRTAQIGDWVVGLGSRRAKSNDGKFHNFSGRIVYAMKITKIMSLEEYDSFCKTHLLNKIPDWNNTKDWRLRMGDCIYDFSNKTNRLRKSVHYNDLKDKKDEDNKDIKGLNALLSDHFYYFGEEPILLPLELNRIAFQNQGHRKFEDVNLFKKLEDWLSQFEKNKVYADPQMKFIFDLNSKNEGLSCSSCTSSSC